MQVLGISGSPRPQGNTDTLLLKALSACREAGAETQFVALRDYEFSPCVGHGYVHCSGLTRCVLADDFPVLARSFMAADGVIIAAPVYFWNVPAQLKAFIDRNYFHYTHKEHVMAARAAGIITVAGSSGFEETEQTLLNFFRRSNQYRGNDHVVLMRARARFPGDADRDQALMEEAYGLGRRVVDMIRGG